MIHSIWEICQQVKSSRAEQPTYQLVPAVGLESWSATLVQFARFLINTFSASTPSQQEACWEERKRQKGESSHSTRYRVVMLDVCGAWEFAEVCVRKSRIEDLPDRQIRSTFLRLHKRRPWDTPRPTVAIHQSGRRRKLRSCTHSAR